MYKGKTYKQASKQLIKTIISASDRRRTNTVVGQRMIGLGKLLQI